MASSFAAQLSRIAAKSSNELDLKAQKASYSESLIFDRRVAGSQDIETVYQICLEGYQELCQLEPRFSDFERSLFSQQSKSQDRNRMTAQENEALNTVLELFLALVGSKILLRPAIKAVEWLVRRFKVHIQNTSFVLSTFLPYHETPIFRSLLSILPAQLPHEYRFLGPYLKTATNPPRHAIAYSATSSDGFFTALNSYTIQVCQIGASHPTLMSFWGSIVVEAVAGRLNLAQSGRKEVQEERQEDVLLKVFPFLSQGFSVSDVPDLILVCYTLTMVLASKCDLADSAIDSLMASVAGTLKSTGVTSGLVCLTILASRKSALFASKAVVSSLMKIQGIEDVLQGLAQKYPVERLLQALVAGSLRDLKKKNYLSRISFVERLLKMSATLSDSTLIGALLAAVVDKVRDLSDQDSSHEAIKSHLTSLLQNLAESDFLSAIINQALSVSGIDVNEMESIMGAILTPQIEHAPPSAGDSVMDVDRPRSSEDLDRALSHLPERTVDQRSFLVSPPSHLFKQLDEAFQTCCSHPSGLTKFANLPIWISTEPESPLYLTFLLRVACGPREQKYRASALRLVARNISTRQTPLDAQALLPYIVVCLAHPARSVRQASSQVLVAVLDALPKESIENQCVRWGAKDLYDSHHDLTEEKFIPTSQVIEIIRGALMPVIEECVFESTQIRVALLGALNGSSKTVRTISPKEAIHLKKTVRHSFFNLLTQHLLATPLLAVKVELISLFDGVDKVGSMSKTRTLLPLLVRWIGLTQEKVMEMASAEGLMLADVDRVMTLTISITEKEALSQLLTVVTENEVEPRPGFVEALFGRIITIWKDLKPESRSSAAAELFDLSMSQVAPLKNGARNALRSADLPTTAFIDMLKQSRQSAAKLQVNPPTRKRRRTSHSQSSAVAADMTEEVDASVARLTFVLELVDDSKAEDRPELLGELFQTLSILQFLRQHGKGQLPYLLRLCLGGILAIVKKAGLSAEPSLDLSVIRLELVTDCVRVAENPQVQNTALLLVAALAAVDPEHVLHSVMPIFTFMSNSVLTKDDEHSVNVTNQTMDQVIPALVAAVRQKDDDNLIRPMSDLLSSFVAAFDHIPQHRRLGLFQRLLSRLGAQEYAFATIGMLALRKQESADLNRFFGDLIETFDAATQMITCRNLLAVVKNVFSSHPDDAEIVAGINSSSSGATKRKAAHTLLSTATHLMKSKALKAQINKVNRLSQDVARRVRDELRTGFSQILELMRDSTIDASVLTTLNTCLEAFLCLPPLAEYFESLPQVLQEVNKDLRVDVLRTVESRLRNTSAKDTKTQVAAVEFLQVLTSFLVTHDNVAFKVAAIACIDRISEIYGRKDVAAVFAAAAVMSQDQCLASSEPQLPIATLLCLASVLEILKENVIPIVPEMMPRVLQLLHKSINEVSSESLHKACFSLLAALVSNVPFMISDDYLDQILRLSAESDNTELEDDCGESRRDFLLLLSRRVEIKQLVSGLARTWATFMENEAIPEALQLLSNSIEHSSKSTVVKVAEPISSFILQALDLRHIQLNICTEDSYFESDILENENSLNDVMIKFIYKLNDNVFRPLFAQWVDWAIECPGIAAERLGKARLLRQTSLFNFIRTFLSTLKSIVTSYARYIVEPATEVLKNAADLAKTKPSLASLMDTDQQAQYNISLSMLTAAASHDQDGFFASPSNFSPLHEVLIAQLNLAANKVFNAHIYTHVIPAIVALAMAVVDTPAHHVSINKLICKLRHSEHAGVRMATIKCQAALTASEEVGEEWVNNIVNDVGETMIYVNEMLEDDDEDIEREVRKWVRRVREMVGEDVFET